MLLLPITTVLFLLLPTTTITTAITSNYYHEDGLQSKRPLKTNETNVHLFGIAADQLAAFFCLRRFDGPWASEGRDPLLFNLMSSLALAMFSILSESS